MKCVDAGPTCVAFLWRQTASWCRLNQVKFANRTLDCANWDHVVYAEETVNRRQYSLSLTSSPVIETIQNTPKLFKGVCVQFKNNNKTITENISNTCHTFCEKLFSRKNNYNA
ncbi:hypothetical protein DPMN_176395 [Dreissena polymorpha]|uniref:Uncharacterized protein n=1 Tax=Dreissena polymorpha TaxID=45954 RepID=A0A9D4E9F4_DREPO|nr:hypothetical protein DPMN_176395 [Dreissena polymorpha]